MQERSWSAPPVSIRRQRYLLNGKLCRLRDIQELFMGTGLGPETYALIEQGRIGQILSSRPTDRRGDS